MIKHSLSIRGHRTSVSLEQPFWDELQRIARRKGVSVSALITRIDANRPLPQTPISAPISVPESVSGGGASPTMPGLSSAIRVFILNDALGRLGGRRGD